MSDRNYNNLKKKCVGALISFFVALFPESWIQL